MKRLLFMLAVSSLAVSCGSEKSGSVELSGTHNGHDWVDLGLSVKWATCNVGADNPNQPGDCYAWGETRTEEYYEGNCETYGKCIEDIKGTERDVAHGLWGGDWRMPTPAEFEELSCRCDWELVDDGYKITGPNGNSIFLFVDTKRYYEQPHNCRAYWTSMPYSLDPKYACGFDIEPDFGSREPVGFVRNHFLMVRPVLE